MPTLKPIDAIERLFALYEQQMYRIAFAVLKDEGQAEDAVMSAFERVVRHQGVPCDPDSSHAQHLMASMARQCAIDIYRKNSRERQRFVTTLAEGAEASAAMAQSAPGPDAADAAGAAGAADEMIALYWDERTNATKGARFQENAQLRWDYRTSAQLAKPNSVSAAVEGELSTEPGSTVPALAADAEAASELPPADKANDAAKAAADLGDVPIGSSIYVDPQRSTNGVLYCYEYLVFPDGIPEGESLAMVIGWSDGALSDVSQASQTQTVDLSGLPVVPATTFTSDSGAQLSLSPLGLTLNMSNGLGLDDSAAKDPGSIAAITLKLANGETYTVFDSAQNMENTMYAMGSGTNFGMNFNRLVDPADVKAVEVSVKDGATVTLS